MIMQCSAAGQVMNHSSLVLLLLLFAAADSLTGAWSKLTLQLHLLSTVCMPPSHGRPLLQHHTYPQDLHMSCMEDIKGPINVDNG
jgi:hypothetical protein